MCSFMTLCSTREAATRVGKRRAAIELSTADERSTDYGCKPLGAKVSRCFMTFDALGIDRAPPLTLAPLSAHTLLLFLSCFLSLLSVRRRGPPVSSWARRPLTPSGWDVLVGILCSGTSSKETHHTPGFSTTDGRLLRDLLWRWSSFRTGPPPLLETGQGGCVLGLLIGSSILPELTPPWVLLLLLLLLPDLLHVPPSCTCNLSGHLFFQRQSLDFFCVFFGFPIFSRSENSVHPGCRCGNASVFLKARSSCNALRLTVCLFWCTKSGMKTTQWGGGKNIY